MPASGRVTASITQGHPGEPPSGPFLAGAILLAALLAAALSVDVVQAGYGVKSDEATYVAMAASLAYDRNLSYERQDLERFWGLYRQGPEGIFLKKGKNFRVRLRLAPPFVRVLNSTSEARTDRLFYGKAFVYPMAAAPFVWLFGLNGFLVLHALLLAAACTCGYWFLAARSPRGPALGYTLAFVGASIVPVYAVFLMPEVFNFALVFIAYFFWLYKEVAEPRSAWLGGWRSDLVAAVLLGVVTYSKPTNLPLIVPVILLWVWRRHLLRAAMVGVLFAAVTGGLFFANAMVTGEFNYQGGDRAQFYGHFPFDGRETNAWEGRSLVTTDDADTANVLAPSGFVARLTRNTVYFMVGRHFGFIPYFFPGALALLAWVMSRERFVAWRVLILVGFGGSVLLLLLFLPYTWSGGGGPPGNRYLIGAYPAVFFVLPPLAGSGRVLLAWIGGTLFTVKVLVNPFVMAKETWRIAETGLARVLPVELTMANDLPIRLDASRSPIPYGDRPDMLLYFLDRNAFPPEPPGMWVSADGRADIIVRSDRPLDHLVVEAESGVETTLTLSMGRGSVQVTLTPGRVATVDVPAAGVEGVVGYAHLLSVRASAGFVPRLHDPLSEDGRNLGALVRFRGVERDAR